MIDPVTSIGSVVVVSCFFLSVEFGWANASGAISKQPSVTIIFFMFVSYCYTFTARRISEAGNDGTRATSRNSNSPLSVAPTHFKTLNSYPGESANRSSESGAMSGIGRHRNDLQTAIEAGSLLH